MEIEKASTDIQLILENTSKPVAIIKLNGLIDQANDTFFKFFEVGKETNIRKIVDKESLDDLGESLDNIKCKHRLTFNLNVIAKKQKLYLTTVDLIFNEIEEKIVVVLNLPIMHQKQARNQSFIGFKKSDSLMVVANLAGYVEDVNDLTNDYFNLPRDYFIGRRCKEFFTRIFGGNADYDTYKQKVIDEGYAEIVQHSTSLTDDKRYFKVTSFYDKVNALFLIRISDCTEQELQKQDLAHKGSLSEVGQLAASIAHEIRNPMTTLKGFTQLLKEGATDEALKYLTVIDDEIVRIESILSEMLFLSKPSTMEKTSICPRKLLDDIIHIIYPKATYEGIEIVQNREIATDSSIYGEEGKLKQVLLNLLKNALESMQPGGTLTITMMNEPNNQLKLIVEDTGKGMNEAQLTQIFSPYFTTRSQGTGLGLPFVLQTVESHGGTITVSSEENHGSRFVLSFPIEKQIVVVEEHRKLSVCVN